MDRNFDFNNPRSFNYVVNDVEVKGTELTKEEMVETITVQLDLAREDAEASFDALKEMDIMDRDDTISVLKSLVSEQKPASRLPFVIDSVCGFIESSVDYDQFTQTDVSEMYHDLAETKVSEIDFLVMFFGPFGSSLVQLLWILTWTHIRTLAENLEDQDESVRNQTKE